MRCDHNPLERGIIFRVVKEFVSSVSTTEHVVNYFTRAIRARRGIEQRYIDRLDPVKKKVRVPFYPPPLPKRHSRGIQISLNSLDSGSR